MLSIFIFSKLSIRTFHMTIVPVLSTKTTFPLDKQGHTPTMGPHGFSNNCEDAAEETDNFNLSKYLCLASIKTTALEVLDTWYAPLSSVVSPIVLILLLFEVMGGEVTDRRDILPDATSCADITVFSIFCNAEVLESRLDPSLDELRVNSGLFAITNSNPLLSSLHSPVGEPNSNRFTDLLSHGESSLLMRNFSLSSMSSLTWASLTDKGILIMCLSVTTNNACSTMSSEMKTILTRGAIR